MAGLHGNAIISRFPLKTPWLHRFQKSDGSWWHRQFHEPRLGGRIALGAILETDIGDIQIMTTHLENNQAGRPPLRAWTLLLEPAVGLFRSWSWWKGATTDSTAWK